MLSFEEALAHILEDSALLGSEPCALYEAHGRVLAETLTCAEPLPPWDYSAMDGYAVHCDAFTGPGPWSFEVLGESRTGHPAPQLVPSSACRIFTGARLPEGANAVIMQENLSAEAGRIRIQRTPTSYENVRRRGEDLEVGAVALERGTRLSPLHLGLLAALDRAEILAARKPRVTILSTGDELRASGSQARAGSIPESNSVMIAALADEAGAHVTIAPLVSDDLNATERTIRAALENQDVLVTIGGVSVGDHDLVRPALEAAGAELDFWKVAIKPGKPLVYGRAGATRVLGLPGNPVSAGVSFVLFGLPLLRALQGDAHPQPSRARLRLLGEVRQKPGRRGFYRGVISEAGITPLPQQSSGSVTNLALATGLIVVPEASSGFNAGDDVEVIPLT